MYYLNYLHIDTLKFWLLEDNLSLAKTFDTRTSLLEPNGS